MSDQPSSDPAKTENNSPPPTSPSNLSVKKGDLLSSTEQFIAHQCNCTTSNSAGLSTLIATKFRYADPYSRRRPDPSRRNRCLRDDESLPGTIQVWRPEKGDKGPIVVGMYAQYEPGKPSRSGDDSQGMREKYFKRCLRLIGDKIEGLESIAFPWQIGCGLAGGDWKVYEGMIKEFAESHPDLKVVIYKLPGAASSGGRGRGRGGSRGRSSGRGRCNT